MSASSKTLILDSRVSPRLLKEVTLLLATYPLDQVRAALNQLAADPTLIAMQPTLKKTGQSTNEGTVSNSGLANGVELKFDIPRGELP